MASAVSEREVMQVAEKEMHIDDLLHLMVNKEASDLHIKVPSVPVLRIDGELLPQEQYPEVTPQWAEEALQAITKPEQMEMFEEQLELDFSYSMTGVARFRVNAGIQRGSVTIAARLINWRIPSIDDLGLPEVCKELVMKPRGLVIVTGPTGSGKSTTLAAMIDYLNSREKRRIVTVEDPIEYLFSDKNCIITQRELGSDTRSFASALKHALRQDPDVILVGEMRDLETIQSAITAAETGHLVLGTLHTPGAPQTVDRIVDVFPSYQQQQIRLQLSNTLEGVLYQTLLRRAHADGRVPAVEVMIATGAIRNLIREAKTHQMLTTMETGAQHGMKSLDQDLAELVRRGLVTLEDAVSMSSNPKELRTRIGQTVQ